MSQLPIPPGPQAPHILHLSRQNGATISINPHYHPMVLMMDFALAIAGIMDVIVTGIILEMGGREANPLANEILMAGGFSSLALFKFISFFFILIGIHWVLIIDETKARKLQYALFGIWAFPPVFGIAQLILHHMGLLG